MSRLPCPYLSVPAFSCFRFHSRSCVSVLIGEASPRLASQALKSRFIPYFSPIAQSVSFPRRFSSPEQLFHFRKLFSGLGSTTLGMFAGSTRTAPLAFN